MTKSNGNDPPQFTILIVPEGSDQTRSFALSHRRVRGLAILFAIVTLGIVVMSSTWSYMAVRANQARVLRAQMGELLQREAQVAELARTLEEVEAGYENIRSLFGAEAASGIAEIWLPPATGGSGGAVTAPVGSEDLPTSWPLTERGFVTQGLLQGGEADHPGIDIAVPTGSYIRAAGGGTVAEAGEDPVYGLYLVLEHADGYRSLYAHTSHLVAHPGERVRRNEVIALSGTSGRSTAPHLHFEILRDGEPVDPLSMVTQP